MEEAGKDVVVLYIDRDGSKHEILLNGLELEEVKRLITHIFARKQSDVKVSDEKLKLLRKDGSEWQSKS